MCQHVGQFGGEDPPSFQLRVRSGAVDSSGGRISRSQNGHRTGLRSRDIKSGRHDHVPDIGDFILSVPMVCKIVFGHQGGCHHQTNRYTFHDSWNRAIEKPRPHSFSLPSVHCAISPINFPSGSNDVCLSTGQRQLCFPAATIGIAGCEGPERNGRRPSGCCGPPASARLRDLQTPRLVRGHAEANCRSGLRRPAQRQPRHAHPLRLG